MGLKPVINKNYLLVIVNLSRELRRRRYVSITAQDLHSDSQRLIS